MSPVCQLRVNMDQYVFWDAFYPTEVVNVLMVLTIYFVLNLSGFSEYGTMNCLYAYVFFVDLQF